MKAPKEKSLKLNFIFNSILTISNFIYPLITFPYVSRILLPIGTGKVSFATSVIYYFNILAQLGIPTYGIRACARVRDDKEKLTRTAHEILLLNLVTSICSYVMLFIALFTIQRLREEKTLMIIMSLTMIFQMIGVEWLYKALEKYAYITTVTVIFKAVAVVAMLLLIHERSDYVIYGGLSIFAASASGVLNFINAHKYIGFRALKKYNIKQHLKPVFIFFAMSVTTTLYIQLNTVMLGFIKTDTDVGYFDAANKIKNILLGFVTSLGQVLLPRTSFYVEQNKMDEFRAVTKKAFNFVVILAASFTVYFVIFASEGILFLSGPAYSGAVLPMKIIMPTVFIIGLTNIMGIQILVPLGKERFVLYSEIAGAATNLVISSILIPHFAATGAAIGMLFAELTVFIAQYIFLRDTMPVLIKQLRWFRLLIPLIFAGVVAFMIKRLPINSNLIILVCSAVAFYGVYGIGLLFAKEPLTMQLIAQVTEKLKRIKANQK
ncbi:MAG: flippase [Lachnospiraceae bacterium]|jgi:O-antigen/teichoic acid export membrane protein|nr:flippase [Lachnospiraceae bacterium]